MTPGPPMKGIMKGITQPNGLAQTPLSLLTACPGKIAAGGLRQGARDYQSVGLFDRSVNPTYTLLPGEDVRLFQGTP